MKWYCRLLTYAAAVAAGFCAGWAYEWATSPLARPMCLDKGADLIPRLIAALPAGYAPFWLAAALPLYGLGLWACISLHKLSRVWPNNK